MIGSFAFVSIPFTQIPAASTVNLRPDEGTATIYTIVVNPSGAGPTSIYLTDGTNRIKILNVAVSSGPPGPGGITLVATNDVWIQIANGDIQGIAEYIATGITYKTDLI
jgi:hypothetical protein